MNTEQPPLIKNYIKNYFLLLEFEVDYFHLVNCCIFDIKFESEVSSGDAEGSLFSPSLRLVKTNFEVCL